ncbi:hypothetical protein Tco_0775715 [Tanacetum coccineum]
MGSITTWDSIVEKFILNFHHLSDHNDDEEIEEEEDLNEIDNAPEIFMIEGNLFDFETPLCEAFNEFNRLLKIDIDLVTYDIQNLKTYDDYKQEVNNDKGKGTEEPWSEKGVLYQLRDHICKPYRFKNEKTKWPTCTSDIDGFCKEIRNDEVLFDDDEEYITIKEFEYLKHSKDSLDAYRELLRLIDHGWVVTTPGEA